METPSMIRNRQVFDEIPDCIILTILSLLEIKDIARICTVSKSLRRLCFSVPDLLIHIENLEDDELRLSSFNYFLHTLLAERDGLELITLNLKSFCPKFNSSNRFDLRKLLCDAVRLKVRSLCLEIVTDRFHLPTFVFNSTIRVLKLNLHNGLLALPNAELASVQELSLSSFKLDDKGGLSLGEWISSCCKAIQKLDLSYFDGIQHLDITHSSLKRLHIIWPRNRLSTVKLSVDSLKILVLFWDIDNYNSFTLFAPNLKRLAYASKNVSRYFFRIFSQLNELRNISLISQSISCLNEQNYIQGAFWKNLKCLRVFSSISMDGYIVRALASFFKASPNLQTLLLKGTTDDSSNTVLKVYDDDVRAADETTLCIDKLKYVRMERIKGDYYEMVLLHQLLKHGKALEKVEITHCLDECQAEKIGLKLEGVRKASSNVSITYNKRQTVFFSY